MGGAPTAGAARASALRDTDTRRGALAGARADGGVARGPHLEQVALDSKQLLVLVVVQLGGTVLSCSQPARGTSAAAAAATITSVYYTASAARRSRTTAVCEHPARVAEVLSGCRSSTDQISVQLICSDQGARPMYGSRRARCRGEGARDPGERVSLRVGDACAHRRSNAPRRSPATIMLDAWTAGSRSVSGSHVTGAPDRTQAWSEGWPVRDCEGGQGLLAPPPPLPRTDTQGAVH